MPSVKLSVPHTLGQAEAVERLKKFLTKIKENYSDQISDLSGEWTDNELNFGFKTYGFRLEGTLTALPAEVLVDLQIPFAAIMFKGKIEQSIRSELSRLLT